MIRAQKVAQIAIILGRVWYRVKFPVQRGEVGALESRQALGELIPQILDALFEHRALEKFQQRQREVERDRLVGGGRNRLLESGQAELDLSAVGNDLEVGPSQPVNQALFNRRQVALERSLGDIKLAPDRLQ